jgi:tetratricopeptide (TPR) repeat protein
MKVWAFFAISLAFAAGTARGQQVPNAPIGATADDTATVAPQPPTMTPKQIAEMRANILMARKDYAGAAKAFEAMLITDPHSASLLNKVGMAYELLGDIPHAERAYKKSVSADKHSSSALNNLGTIEYSAERYGKAIKYYKKAIATGDVVPADYTNLGYAYCGIKEFPRAMDAFNKALALDPEVFDHKGGIGSILQQRSTTDPADLHFLLAKSYAKIGDAVRTARYLKMARDEGYKDFLSVEKDPAFARVIKDEGVQDVLKNRPAFAGAPDKPVSN